MRYTYYGWMSALEDEETQRRGGICVMMSFGENISNAFFDFDFNSRTGPHFQGLPMRVCGFHFCTDNPGVRALDNFKRVFLGGVHQKMRTKFRVHCGAYPIFLCW